MNRKIYLSLVLVSIFCLQIWAQGVNKPFKPIFKSTVRGDVISIGNVALSGAGAPGSSEVPPGGTSANNGTTAIFVDVDGDPSTFMSSSAKLKLPSNGGINCPQIIYAGLYWAANTSIPSTTLTREGRDSVKMKLNTGAYIDIVADSFYLKELNASATRNAFFCFADVTNFFSTYNIATDSILTVANIKAQTGVINRIGAWTLVLVFSDPNPTTFSTKNITIYQGLADLLANNNPLTSTTDVEITDFVTPPAPATFNSDLIFMGYEGDRSASSVNNEGVFLKRGLIPSANPFTNITNTTNPNGNPFNSTITNLDVPVTTSDPNPFNTLGYDLDRYRLPVGLLQNGDSTATVKISTQGSGETFVLHMLTTAIDVKAPLLTIKDTYTDINGAPLKVGDTLLYNILVENRGNDTAVFTEIIDSLRFYLPIDPNSFKINGVSQIPNSGGKVDFFPALNYYKVRLGDGTGNTAATAGNLPPFSILPQTFNIQLKFAVSGDCNLFPSAQNYIINRSRVYFEGKSSGFQDSAFSVALNSSCGVIAFDTLKVLGCRDLDGDTITDFIDKDDDNDGIPDYVEICGPTTTQFTPSCPDPVGDADNDGVPNFQDPNFGTLNSNGVVATMDFDGDGFINSFDLDADNDGITDVREAYGAAGDPDNNGQIGTGIGLGIPDADLDGLKDPADLSTGGTFISAVNSDNSGRADYLDIDADNDGITDRIESLLSNSAIANAPNLDTDEDGLLDALDNLASFGGQGTIPVNTDGTDQPDYLDLDSDNDTDDDRLEGWDTDNDGVANVSPTGADTDGDGLLDGYDVISGPVPNDGKTAALFPNLDKTATPELDWRENSFDNDNDGIPDSIDLDDDNDGVSDIDEGACFQSDFESFEAPIVPLVNGNNIQPAGPLNGFSNVPASAQFNIIRVNGAPYANGAVTAADGSQYIDIAGANAFPEKIITLAQSGVLDVSVYLGNRIDGGYAPWTGRIEILNSANTVIKQGNLVSFTAATSKEIWYKTEINQFSIAAGTYKVRVFVDNFGHFDKFDLCLSLDNDGDGIPNQFDLDSDNDGITDITENNGSDPDNDGIVGSGVPLVNSTGVVLVAGNPVVIPIKDFDGDGVPNQFDLDSDNDGITDVKESGGSDPDNNGIIGAGLIVVNGNGQVFGTTFTNPLNTDGTGALTDTNPNYLDLDADNDGIIDNIEGQSTSAYTAPSGVDTDGDGIDNTYDNIVGPSGSGVIPNNQDLADTPDYIDLDSDNDILPDNIENGLTIPVTNADTDVDGILNDYDFNFGIPTTLGTVLNVTNNTQTPNTFPNNFGTTEKDWREGDDSDGDGIFNTLDDDDDNDGIPDSVEIIGGDTDEDGIPNILDLDSDNDGIPDTIENGVSDPDKDGIAGTGILTISNGGVNASGVVLIGGVPVVVPTPPNFDGDGRPNYLDIDSDNDGITDVRESGLPDSDNNGFADGTDTDKDGLVSAIDANTTFGGTGALVNIPNTDNENVLNPDYLDIDADDDGIVDIIEAQATGAVNTFASQVDFDNDGLIDDFNDNDTLDYGGAGFIPFNKDNTDVPDYIDTDTDNDGLTDVQEGLPGTGTATTDADSDGLNDKYDLQNAISPIGLVLNITNGQSSNSFPDIKLSGGDRDWRDNGLPPDFDGDGVPDSADVDDDNDGILDVNENPSSLPNLDADADGDGIANYLDTDLPGRIDANNDGVDDRYDNDLDGKIDSRDLDSDNDGITDVIEAGGADTNGDGLVDCNPTTSVNTQGLVTCLPNTGLGILDQDNDGIPNSEDLDADNDGIMDIVEVGGTDANGDGKVDVLTDSDGDGLANVADPTNGNLPTSGTSGITPPIVTGLDTNNDGKADAYPQDNIDNDTKPNFLDLDSDNDGVADVIEAGGSDSDNDGLPGSGIPTVNTNGQVVISGIPVVLTPLNTDNDTRPNYLDLDSDNDGIPDTIENEVSDPDKDGIAGTGTPVVNTNGQVLNGIVPVVAPLLDFDGDGIANQNDLDSDNDGITDVREGGGTDPDNNGQIGNGNGATIPDEDGDGLADILDPTNIIVPAGTPLLVTNTDNNGKPNYLDIDSDNDGIVDLIEGLATLAYPITPLDFADTDGDGLINQFDNLVGFGGNGINPVNTDNTDVPDYMDLNSDNDALSDYIEVFDINNNGIIDGTEIVPLTTDADGDGLLDGFDSVVGGTNLGSVGNVTNGNNSGPSLFSDEIPATPEKDWREPAVGLFVSNDVLLVVTGNTGTVNILSNDLPSSGLTIGSILNPVNNGVTSFVGGVLTYTPTLGFVGYDTLVVNVCLGATCLPNTVIITVLPKLLANTSTTNINTQVSGNANTGNTPNSGLVFGTPTVVGTNNGVFTISPAGAYTFTPTTGFTGTTTYIIPVCLNTVTPQICANDTVIINVLPSSGLLINDETITVLTGDSSVVNILVNDFPAGVTVGAIVNPVNNGTTSIVNGVLSYTSTLGFVGYDTLVVQVCLSTVCANDTILIKVLPKIVKDVTTTLINTPVGGNANTNNTPNSGLVYGTPSVIGTSNGTFTISSTGAYTFTPSFGFVGVTSYTVSVCKNTVTPPICANDTIIINVIPISVGSDVDSDNVQDSVDLDDDNDGIPDYKELCGANATQFTSSCQDPLDDSDNDGIPNYKDPNFGTLNSDGVVASMDTDGDGIINTFDLDSDNDGILDLYESGNIDAINSDLNSNGTISIIESAPGADGIPLLAQGTEGAVPPITKDTDGDGKADLYDLDTDNDGINDLTESGNTGLIDANSDGVVDGPDADNDGIRDSADTNDGAFGDPDTTDTPRDTDGDGIADFRDLDADNDGINDITESGNPGLIDANSDGVVDGPDTDGDGIRDSADANDTTYGDAETTDTPRDTDGDGVPDYRDLDSDNDGINDITESGYPNLEDTNSDGIVDGPDADGDGIQDSADGNDSAFGDPDTNDTPNSDLLNPNGPFIIGSDSDGDGIIGEADGNPNAFGDAPTESEVLVSELVSPNGDDKNDVLIIRGLSKTIDPRIDIYNRWGNKVYEGAGADLEKLSGKAWDGTNAGLQPSLAKGDSPEGTYYYVFEYTDKKTNVKKVLKGFIYLNRK